MAISIVGGENVTLPDQRGLYYGDDWHEAADGNAQAITSPSTGEALGTVSWAGVADVDHAVAAAQAGFREWRRVKPLERARILREAAAIIRASGRELALIDAADCGNPVAERVRDAEFGAASLDYFAGLVLEMKGSTSPMGEGVLNYTLRQPLGVVVRINAYNHPFMFSVVRAGAPLAAGNSLIIKPPEQAPLSSLRLAELIGPLFPAGAFNVLPGGRACGEALVAHPDVAKVGLIGSVPTGRAILRGAAETMKKVSLALGGKNALVAYADADPEKVAAGVAGGMNFTWCGQSCGSTSRAFLHESLHDAVLERVAERVRGIKPGLPTRFDTQMGCLVNQAQFDKVLRYVAWGQEDGARLVCGGAPPSDPELKHGLFIEPAVFADVRPGMRIAQEEIFGPVLSVFRWSDEAEMMHAVNDVDYGLTDSIWTKDLVTAHRAAASVEAGYVWVNQTSTHFLGAPFGGWKQSGMGREESIDEMLDCTQLKNVNIALG